MPKSLLFFLFFLFPVFSYGADDSIACTREYAPVCAQPAMPECPSGMVCDMMMPARKTYSNLCMATADKATNPTTGACLESQIVGGDLDIHGCKPSAGYIWNNVLRECVRPWMIKTRIMMVLGDTIGCTGVGPMQCLQVKKGKKTELFYSPIIGFTPMSGSIYRVLVREDKVENPPADSSDRIYTLVRVISKRPVSETQNQSPVAGTWTLDTYNGKKVNGKYLLTFGEENMNAKFCNNMFGSYSVSKNIFKAPAIASTLMYCEGESMQLEDAFALDGASYNVMTIMRVPGSVGPTIFLSITTKKGDIFLFGR